MSAELFLQDLRRKPEALRSLAERLRDDDPWRFLERAPERVLLLGMGSSAYAGEVAAARLRARAVVAVSELASTDLLPSWGRETAVVAISAGGASHETLDALDRLGSGETSTALTNVADSPLADRCAHVVPLQAGQEHGGVACRTFQHTLILLLALERHLLGEPMEPLAADVERVAEATQYLLDAEDEWGPRVTGFLAGGEGAHLAAPARRMSSARQGALMLREGPRRGAVACESGDWSHVDVYLTKNTDYRLLAFAGSRWDDSIAEWTGPRGTTVVAVGGSFPGAVATVRYPHDHLDDVRLLTETLVPELVAARLWLESDVGG
jgi:glucosamine 6-phosphate synthetase-like amidotransferase/phosphosugar isomerase protein